MRPWATFGLCEPSPWSSEKRSESWAGVEPKARGAFPVHPHRPCTLSHLFPEGGAWPLSPDAMERSWRGLAVRQRSWGEASPYSRGSPTSPSTVSEQSLTWGAQVMAVEELWRTKGQVPARQVMGSSFLFDVLQMSIKYQVPEPGNTCQQWAGRLMSQPSYM